MERSSPILKLESIDSDKEFIACGVMYTFESISNLGFYNEDFKMREGHELHKRFLERYKIYNLKMPLYRYRIHENNRTNNKKNTDKYDSKLGENKWDV